MATVQSHWPVPSPVHWPIRWPASCHSLGRQHFGQWPFSALLRIDPSLSAKYGSPSWSTRGAREIFQNQKNPVESLFALPSSWANGWHFGATLLGAKLATLWQSTASSEPLQVNRLNRHQVAIQPEIRLISFVYFEPPPVGPSVRGS